MDTTAGQTGIKLRLGVDMLLWQVDTSVGHIPHPVILWYTPVFVRNFKTSYSQVYTWIYRYHLVGGGNVGTFVSPFRYIRFIPVGIIQQGQSVSTHLV